MVDLRKSKIDKPTIAEDFFVIKLLDSRINCCWAKVIGKRKGIDKVFDWCRENLIYDDFKWLSILSHDRDAVILDIHFFDDETYQKFFMNFEKFYLPDEEGEIEKNE